MTEQDFEKLARDILDDILPSERCEVADAHSFLVDYLKEV